MKERSLPARRRPDEESRRHAGGPGCPSGRADGVVGQEQAERRRGDPRGVLYQWIRVTNSQGRTLGTFFLQQSEGQPARLFLATPRKGLPLNPFDETALSNAGWSAEQVRQAQESVDRLREAIRSHPGGIDEAVEVRRSELVQVGVPDSDFLESLLAVYREDLEAAERRDSRVSKSDKVEKFLRRPSSTHGQRVTNVIPIATMDRDTQFRFLDGRDSITVRGSKLGPVLMGYRHAERHHVSLKEIEGALRYLAQCGTVLPQEAPNGAD